MMEGMPAAASLGGSLAAVDGRMRAIAARCESFDPAGATSFAAVLAGLGVAAASPAPSASGVAAAPASDRATPASIARAIDAAARERGLDPSLLHAVVTVESGGDPFATSAAGAQGLMQLMPQTARELGVTEPYDATQNVRGGAAYLRSLLDRFGDARLALAAYNAGPGAVESARGIPAFAETRAYVERVSREAERLRAAT